LQNIDPLYILEPAIVIALSVTLILYWKFSGRSFTRWALIFSLAAYAGAIIIKVVFQLLTVNAVTSTFGTASVATGLYYGLQTVILEVGGAYVVAVYAVSRKRFSERDAGAYGISLAFWENGIYLGLFSLVSLISIYAVLAAGPGASATLVYNALQKGEPALFNPPSVALSPVAFGILERISSIMLHCAWGYLTVLSAVYRKKNYLAIALPMGLADFFVPFASELGLATFEGIVFLIGVVSLLVALQIGRHLPKSPPAPETLQPDSGVKSSP
jgi:YhfC intramembrane metalloprotease